MAAGSGAIALAAVLAACSGSGSSPTVVPPLSTTPTTSTTSAPTQDPKAAAVAVVRQYFALLNNLERDMNAEAFAKLQTAKCPCRKLVRTIQLAKDRGEHYYGHARVRALTPVADSERRIEVLAVYDSTVGGLRRDTGETVTSVPGRKGVTENFYLSLVGGRWLISSLVPVSNGHR